MGDLPAILERVQAQFASFLDANGFVLAQARHNEAVFGSAFAEYRGPRCALRLVWDGKERLPVDHDQSEERISRILEAATCALSGERSTRHSSKP